MRDQFRQITINFAPVNVVGVPGLMLVLIAIALAVQFPEARWLVVSGLAGGSIIAALLVWRRSRTSRGDGDGGHGILTVSEEPATKQYASKPRPRSGSALAWS